MDLITLNDDHQPEKLLENYDSLIWSERYNTLGDFQLTTGNIEQFMEVMPEGKVLSLRESNVPMIVENHKIERKKNSPVTLTITGREYVSILDRRISVQAIAPGTSEWTVVAKIPSDVAYYAMQKICVEGILSPLDIFPPEKVQFIVPDDYLDPEAGPNRMFTIPRENLLTAVLSFVQTEAKYDGTTTPPTRKVDQHGIRAVRPDASGTAIGIEIYTGRDLTETVYYDATRDLLNDGTYLFSKVGSATTAHVLGASNVATINTVTDPSGLDRRVILVDGTTSGISNEASLIEQGKMSLSEAKITAIFDGSINEHISPYVFGRDYRLGDIVKMVGDYGLHEKARVTEFIRSEDATGSQSYPTLTTIEE